MRIFCKELSTVHGVLSWQRHYLSVKRCTSSQLSSRLLSSQAVQKRKRYFITTPIFYVNAAPHIGHLYTALLADAATRWRSLQGYDVVFSTGTDEHGLKIQHAAELAGMLPQQYCDQVSQKFKDLFEKADVSYTHFVRTTDAHHRQAVEEFWKTLSERGYIYRGSYEGWYSVSDESFVGEQEVTDTAGPDGKIIKVCSVTGNPVEWVKEDNYMFRLSEFKSQLTEWLDKSVIMPSVFKGTVYQCLDTLQDLSVSRSHERLNWGIPVPGDQTQTIYVWLDALVNYLGVAGYPDNHPYWPADVHVVGKDIIKFHAVYWPAFLMAAGLDTPKQILCHSHWKCDGVKMSKSRGNVVDPVDRLQKYTSDGLRFFLLRDGTPAHDNNYTDVTAVQIINGELVNNFANLLSRCTGSTINPKQIIPPLNECVLDSKFSAEDKEMFANLYTLTDEVDIHYKEFCVYKSISSIFTYVDWANKVINKHRPWVLVKTAGEEKYLETLLHLVLETIRVCSILLQPVIPRTCEKVFARLNIPEDQRLVSSTRGPLPSAADGHQLGLTSSMLFKRLK